MHAWDSYDLVTDGFLWCHNPLLEWVINVLWPTNWWVLWVHNCCQSSNVVIDFDSGTVTETRMVIEQRHKKIKMSLWQRSAVVPNKISTFKTRDEFPAWMLVVTQWFGCGYGFRFDIGFIVTTIGGYRTKSPQVPQITSYFHFYFILFFLYLQF